MSLSDLVGRFDAWVVAYNRRRPHGGLGGATPEERWLLDAAPLRLVPPAELRWLLLEERTRKVAKSGIRFHCLDFVAPELNGLVGETVDVRYRPHDDTSIEVFRNGAHLCTRSAGALGEAERAAVLPPTPGRHPPRRIGPAGQPSGPGTLAPMTRPGRPRGGHGCRRPPGRP